MNVTSYRCPTCDKEHLFTPYVIARLPKEELRHHCNACGGVTQLGAAGIVVVQPGGDNPHYWAANGHYPCVVTLRGESVPRVFAYKYDGSWYAQRDEAIANIEASIARIKVTLPENRPAPEHPGPQPTPWYGNNQKPAYLGWYHLLFTGGEAAKNWYWDGARFLIDKETEVALALHAVKGWRGQDREFE